MKLLVSTEARTLTEMVTGLELFTAFTVVVGRVIAREHIRPRNHGTLRDFLLEEGVDVLLCTHILPPVKDALIAAGLEVHPLATQDAHAGVAHYLAHELDAATVGESAAGECLGDCTTCANPCH